jgi:hypothetical protein
VVRWPVKVTRGSDHAKAGPNRSNVLHRLRSGR